MGVCERVWVSEVVNVVGMVRVAVLVGVAVGVIANNCRAGGLWMG